MKIRFRLISLLVLTTIVCISLAWFMRPKYVEAEAQFLVRSQPDRLLPTVDAASKLTREEVLEFRATILELVSSDPVIRAAVRDPALARCALLSNVDDPVGWLRQNLEVQFEGDSEIMLIRLEGREEWANDLITIVNAVAEAFDDEVLTKQRLERVNRADELRAHHRDLSEEIRSQLEVINGIAADLPSEDQAMDPELVLRKAELEALIKLQTELAELIKRGEIERGADQRITLQHAAVIRED